MSFDTIENSAEGGRPVEIFTFQRGANIWRYTSADRDVTVDSQPYKKAVIKRGSISQGSEPARSVLSLIVPRKLEVLDQYRVVPPSDEVSVLVRSYHHGDTDIKVVWQGVILGVSFNDNEAQIQAEPRSNGLRKSGLRRVYQRQCPHVLYGPGCQLLAENFRVTGTAVTVNALSVQVPIVDPYADGYFDGGYIEWQVGVGTYERRLIASHVGDLLSLDIQPVGLVAGAQVRVYPGCDRTSQTCSTKFSNILNYGGMPYIPLKNPFGSDPVY